MTDTKQEWLLTKEKIGRIIHVENGNFLSVAKAQLAKDEARFEKERELIRKDEGKRIFKKIEAQSNNLLRRTGLFQIVLTEEEWQALKGEGK